ncbi:MAG: hypothetical protein ABIK92_08345 [Pseudomonadota bacterium]
MIKLFQITVFVLLFLCAQISFAEKIFIESRVADGSWRSELAIEPLIGQKVFLRVKEIDGASIQWFRIQPNINIRYNNAVWPWLPNAYKWKGFDEIKYSRILLPQFDGKWKINIFPKKGSAASQKGSLIKNDSLLSYFQRRLFDTKANESSFASNNIGSFWFQAEVTKSGQKFATPGIESKDHRGLSNKVFRISIKQGNDLLGNLTSYFNVPAVFGSTPYQVKNHIGIDCADVLMAAYSKSKNLPIAKDYNVAMLTSKFKTVVKSRIEDGQPVSKIRWQKDIRAGDFIAVKYSVNGQYQHIGVLYNDQNGNGLLDGEDLILHAGPDPLHFSMIKSGPFDGTIAILRTE